MSDTTSDSGAPMRPGHFIDHNDGTSTFIPDVPWSSKADTTHELQAEFLGVIANAYKKSGGMLDEVAKAVTYWHGVKLQQYGREQRIDALQRILGHWHHGSHPSPETVVKLAERDLAVLKTMKREPDDH